MGVMKRRDHPRLLLTTLLLLVFPVAAQQQQPSPPQQQPRTRCGKWDTSKIDPAYTKTANATGGQVFALDPCDPSSMGILSATHGTNLLSIHDRLTGQEKSYSFSVDPAVVHVSVSATGVSTLRVEQPNGASLVAGTHDVQHFNTLNGQAYAADNPQPGTWKVLASGEGDVTLRVSARFRSSTGGSSEKPDSTAVSAPTKNVEAEPSNIDFWQFRFLEFGGRPAHEGYFPIPGYPIARSTSHVEAMISGEVSTATFEFRASDGTVLQKFRLQHKPFGRNTEQFSGEVQVPEVAFQVYVTGLDMHGHRYQRARTHVIEPRKFAILGRHLTDLHPGETTNYKVEVKNYGPPTRFKISGRSKHNFLRSLAPENFALASNESAHIVVTLQAPPEVDSGDDEIMLSVASADNPEETNFAQIDALILPKH